MVNDVTEGPLMFEPDYGYPSERLMEDWAIHQDHAEDIPPDGLEHNCPDCWAAKGETHGGGCDVARCQVTGRQRLSCPAFGTEGAHDCGMNVWTGEWPADGIPQTYVGPLTPEAVASLARVGRDFVPMTRATRGPDILRKCNGDRDCPVHPGALPHDSGELFPVRRDDSLRIMSVVDHHDAMTRTIHAHRGLLADVARVAREELAAGSSVSLVLAATLRRLDAEGRAL